MIYNIIYNENNKPIRLQSVKAYKFDVETSALSRKIISQSLI